MSWSFVKGGRVVFTVGDYEPYIEVTRDLARDFAEAFREEMRQPGIRRIIEASFQKQKQKLEQNQIAPVKFLED